MRPLLVVVVVACLISCERQAQTPGPVPTPVPATPTQLSRYYGSYSDGTGDVIVIARLGWFFDMKSAAYRTIYATADSARFTIGLDFLRPLPKFADLSFSAGTLKITTAGHVMATHRVGYVQKEVEIPAGGAQLAGEITEPLADPPHPGVVIVHGAERGERYFYDVWVGIYAAMGFEVLTYDKRGTGSSTGTYPGEQPSASALAIYADDAAAALAFLAQLPGIDARRVGFHGGSQGGWTVPLAIMGHPRAAFAVLVAAPATTVDQTDLWAGFTDGGASAPTETEDQMLAAVRATRGGYDPMPAVRSLTVPSLWILGTNDRTVPTAVCVEILDAMRKSNFSVHLVPTGHGLLVNSTGLAGDDARSPGLAPDLVPTLDGWLEQHVIAA